MDKEKEVTQPQAATTVVQKPVASPTPPEQQTIDSKARLLKRYPNINPSSDDDWEKLRMKAHDDWDKNQQDTEKQQKEFEDMLHGDPDFAALMAEVYANHTPIRVAIAKLFRPEDLQVPEGDPDYKKYKDAYEGRLAEFSKRQEALKQIDANEIASNKVIDDYIKSKGYSPEQDKTLCESLNKFYDNLVQKKVSPNMLEMIDKASHFNEAMAQAREEGEIKGRNAQIEDKRQNEIDQAKGDGIPAPQGGGATPPTPQQPPKKKSFFDGIGMRYAQFKEDNN